MSMMVSPYRYAVVGGGSTAVLTSTTGFNKNTFCTVNAGTPLNFSVAATGSHHGSRATIPAVNTQILIEVTVGNNQAWTCMGIDNGTRDLTVAGLPGRQDTTGWMLQFWEQDATLWYNSLTVKTFSSGVVGNFQNGDKVALAVDLSARTAQLWRSRSGTSTQIGTTSGTLTALSGTDRYAVIGGFHASNVASGTVNFGASTFANPVSGYTYYA